MGKKILLFVAFFFLLGVSNLFFVQSQTNAGSITLNYANFPPAPSFPCVQMERWKDEVEKRTNGQIKINTFPGGTLLGAKAMMEGVEHGIADIGCICMAYQPGRFFITNATSLPVGIPDAKTGSLVLLNLYKKYKPKAFKNVKVLTMFTTAPANIMSKIKINSLRSIKGVDLRASGGAAMILKAWGANPVGMPMPTTVEALQKGIVKGLFSSLEVMKDLKFAESCKYVTMTNTVIYPFAVIMNKSKWNSLPKSVKKVFNDLELEQAKWVGNLNDNKVKSTIKWSKNKHNVKYINLSKFEKKQWDKKLKNITKNWLKQANGKNLPGKKILKDIKRMINKYDI